MTSFFHFADRDSDTFLGTFHSPGLECTRAVLVRQLTTNTARDGQLLLLEETCRQSTASPKDQLRSGCNCD